MCICPGNTCYCLLNLKSSVALGLAFDILTVLLSVLEINTLALPLCNLVSMIFGTIVQSNLLLLTIISPFLRKTS